MDTLQDYWVQELDEYPELTQRTDPYIKTLVQSFARISKSIQQNTTLQANKVAYQLINLLHPSVLYKNPSCSILQFEPKTSSIGKIIKRNSILKHEDIHITTSSDVHLTDTQILSEFDLGSSFELTYRSVLTLTITNIRSSKLKLYLNLDYKDSFLLYKLLFEQKHIIYDEKSNKTDITITQANVDHPLYSVTDYSDDKLKLLHDYNVFYKHFMFVELNNLPITSNLKIIIPLSNLDSPKYIKLKSNSLLANCTAVVNLFEHTCVPIKYNDHSNIYKLTSSNPDWAIHSPIRIEKLNQTHSILHHYSFDDTNYWTSLTHQQQHMIQLHQSNANSPFFTQNDTILPIALHYNHNIDSLSDNTSFQLKHNIPGVHAHTLHRFTDIKAEMHIDFYSKLLTLLKFDINDVQKLIKFYKSIAPTEMSDITRVEYSYKAVLQSINNITCAVPCLLITLFAKPTDFVFANIIKHTLINMSTINQIIEVQIKL